MTTAAEPKDKAVAAKRKTLPELLQDPGTAQRFEQMLGKDARSFQQNILTVFNSGTLAGCDPESIIAAAAISASINLSILPSLGQSCIVPYREGKDGPVVAQWQIMWKGIVQLAHRSSQYKRINLAHVYEGELVRYDKFKGIVELNEKLRKSNRVQGYYFYFELITGGTFEFYWSAKECIEHGLRYSKSFQKGNGKWAEDPEFVKAGTVNKWLAAKEQFLTEGSGADAMSAKTIVKNELQTWGPLETRIKEFVAQDQAVIGADGAVKYIDTTAEPASTKTYAAPPAAGAPGKEEPTPAVKLAWARDAAKKQGVSEETFNAWLDEQEGDEAAKAEAATVAWKRVAAKQATAVEVFKVQGAAQTATFNVTGAATSEFNGEEAYAVRDDSDPVVKYFTASEEVFKAAKAAQKAETPFAVKWIEKESGGKTFRWITQLA